MTAGEKEASLLLVNKVENKLSGSVASKTPSYIRESQDEVKIIETIVPRQENIHVPQPEEPRKIEPQIKQE